MHLHTVTISEPNAPLGVFNQPLPTPTPRPMMQTSSVGRSARPARETAWHNEAGHKLARMAFSPPPADPRETHWRHQHWAGKRAIVLEAMIKAHRPETQLDAFRNCGAEARTEWSDTAQRRRLCAYYCHCRHCEPCARSKANKIAANLKRKLKGAGKHEYRLLTFTLRHNDAPLVDQIRRLYKAFKTLRSRPGWKRTQTGGAVMLEVKWTGKQWHPHLHAVGQGKYISKETLSKLWHEITGDSFIVDVRAITRHEDAAHYVTKYITKSTSESVWSDPAAAQEWIIASVGLRTCNTYGNWRKFPLLKNDQQVKDWVPEARLVRILERAEAGERISRDILNNLRPPGRIDEEQISTALSRPTDDAPPA